ncbi:MAG: hypothetical protein KDB80_02380 [Planctomycetes bacterium]|nr:hypothetical protein [Planctomycetota bacterium]
MTSHRKRKREAKHRGMSVPELELCELLEEVLDRVRWLQILGYSNQFLLDRYVKVPDAERDKVLEAAVRAVDKDTDLEDWHERLARVKRDVARVRPAIRRARKDMTHGLTPPDPPGSRSVDADRG